MTPKKVNQNIVKWIFGSVSKGSRRKSFLLSGRATKRGVGGGLNGCVTNEKRTFLM